MEATKLVIENWLVRREDLWQQSCLGPTEHALVCRFITPIEETILLLVVPMDINENTDALCLLQHRHLYKVDLRVHHRMRVSPPSIQVDPNERASSVTDRHSINTQHRCQLDHVVLQDFIVFISVDN